MDQHIQYSYQNPILGKNTCKDNADYSKAKPNSPKLAPRLYYQIGMKIDLSSKKDLNIVDSITLAG